MTDFPGTGLNGQSLENRGGAVDSVVTRIRNEWSMFRDLMSLLGSRGLPLKAKDRCIHGLMLYGSEIWPVKEKDVIQL